MPTWVMSRHRPTVLCPPQVEALEERCLLDGGSLLSELTTPLKTPAALAQVVAPPESDWVILRAWHDSGPLAARLDAAPEHAFWLANPPGFPSANDALFTPHEVVLVQQGPQLVMAWDPALRQLPGGLMGWEQRFDQVRGEPPELAHVPAADVVAAITPALLKGHYGPVDRAPGAETSATPAPEAVPTGAANTPIAHGPEPLALSGYSLGSLMGSASAVMSSFVVRTWAGEVTVPLLTGGRDAISEPNPLASREHGALASADQDEHGGEAPAPLPQAAGLLTEGVTLGATALERAVEALTEPLGSVDSGSAGALYWLGCSSWLVAAALACEAARRTLPRRPADALPRLANLLPEGEP
jgi:hypothetical protein